MKILVTGSAGFIGFHLASRLLAEGHEVLGFDGLTAYYDVGLKQRRNALLLSHRNYSFVHAMLEDGDRLCGAVESFSPEIIVHLAGQPGVRHGLDAPDGYVASNIVGMFNLLEAAKRHRPQHLLFASTSSVYGGNDAVPFGEAERSDFPLSFYAATKKAGEAMSHAYAHLWKIPTTCFRFFTVYGPWGRPDMALFRFADRIERGEPVELHGMGQMKREVTDIADLVEAVVRLIPVPPRIGHPVDGVVDSLSPAAPWRTVNIAGGAQVSVLELVEAVEAALGRTARKVFVNEHEGEAAQTAADSRLLRALTGFTPQSDLAAIVRGFVDWYRSENKAGQRLRQVG